MSHKIYVNVVRPLRREMIEEARKIVFDSMLEQFNFKFIIN